ncbi:MAG TPA: UDP-N-acetylmuramoyl-L-alanine--D-glutamate ligase [Coriobacteriia bacterium]|jgi:UDP-N-acetylmuramoylalanine--D-glutamate ligase
MALSGDILVLGLGLSGCAVAAYLAEEACHGAKIRVTALDEAPEEALAGKAARLRRAGVEVRLGATEVDGGHDLVVASPGIPLGSPLMVSARKLGVPVISEIELAYRESRSPFVAVTGTNGKTTVTALIGHVLTECGVPAEMVGNIGRPAIEAVAEVGRETVLVAEVSSFQLALTVDFHPRVAVLLNITPDHVDWHGSLEAYTADKARVFANLSAEDHAVIDVDDAGSAPFAGEVEARGVRVVRVSRTALHAGGAAVVDGFLTLDTPEGPQPLVAVEELAIRGDHNVSNALAAAAAAHAMGAPLPGIRAALRSFKPIEHRLEPVEWVRDVEYFNDSKATNPDAVLKALTAFDERPLVLLLGGHNKGNDFRSLAENADARCKLVVLFGEARPELEEAFAGLAVSTRLADTMLDALQVASETAAAGDVVLLSPACASFDEFTSYEHRGRVFKEAVLRLARGEAV